MTQIANTTAQQPATHSSNSSHHAHKLTSLRAFNGLSVSTLVGLMEEIDEAFEGKRRPNRATHHSQPDEVDVE